MDRGSRGRHGLSAMREERVEFISDGNRLRGILRLPDAQATEPLPVLVQGPGWLGLADAKTYVPWHQGLTAAGYAVFAFDYRGFGNSEGERGWVRPEWQLADILNAVTYVETREELDSRRIGTYGVGGTGGGNAIVAAATPADGAFQASIGLHNASTRCSVHVIVDISGYFV